ncbi:MFS transporter [Nocardioides sp. JQ2195]|nr:MFS transporter [Nocardioides sp. JQ2195]
MPVFLLAVLSPYVRSDLDFGASRLGLTVGCYFTFAAVGAMLVGPVADRVSARLSAVAAGALCAGGGLGVAVWGTSWRNLVILMAVLGLANAACQVTANLTLARSISAERRGFGFAVKQSAIPAAILVAGLCVPIANGALGWRAMYAATGLLGLVVVVLGLGRRQPVVARAAGSGEDDRPPLLPLVLLMIAMTFGSAAANSMGAFVATWGAEIGLSPARVGVVMALGSGLNILVRLVSGLLADRRQGRNLPVVTGQFLIGALALMVLSWPSPTIFWPVTVLAFALGWSWPGLMMYAVVRISRDGPATASGMLQAGAFAGGAAGPMCFGLLGDTVGFVPAWRFASAVFVIGAALIVIARRLLVTDLVNRPPREPLGYGGGRLSNPARMASRPASDE